MSAFHLTLMFRCGICRRVRGVLSEFTMARVRIVILFLIGAVCFLPDVTSAKKPNPTTYVGHFTVLVRGHWTGQGDATVAAGALQIVATVTDDQGNVGTLSALDLKIVDGHFTGAGTVFGLDMKVDGRVEAEDPAPAGKVTGKGKGNGSNDQQVVLNARIGATFTAGTHGGRIAGSRDE